MQCNRIVYYCKIEIQFGSTSYYLLFNILWWIFWDFCNSITNSQKYNGSGSLMKQDATLGLISFSPKLYIHAFS